MVAIGVGVVRAVVVVYPRFPVCISEKDVLGAESAEKPFYIGKSGGESCFPVVCEYIVPRVVIGRVRESRRTRKNV